MFLEIWLSDLGAKVDGIVREDHFVITVASEIMAILMSVQIDMKDLKERLGKMIVAYNYAGRACYSSRFKGSRCNGSIC